MSNAYNTTKKATTYDTDDDIDNDNDITDAARQATFNAPAKSDRLSPECARHQDPGSEPKSRLSGPSKGVSSLDVSASTGVLPASPAPAGSGRGRKPDDVYRALANPSVSFYSQLSMEGTGTQAKTCGQDPGHCPKGRRDVVRPIPEVLESHSVSLTPASADVDVSFFIER